MDKKGSAVKPEAPDKVKIPGAFVMHSSLHRMCVSKVHLTRRFACRLILIFEIEGGLSKPHHQSAMRFRQCGFDMLF